MEMGTCRNEDHAVELLTSIRSHKPYKYGGTWHVSCSPKGTALAYRNRSQLSKRMSAEFAELGQSFGSYRVLTVKF